MALTSRPASQVVVRATVFVAIVLLALLATFLRQEGVPKARTLWAEDGAVFAACAYERGPLPCVMEAYGGYFHVVPRLGAFVVPMGDPADLPFRITLVSALVAAAAALLAGRAVVETSGSWTAGLLAGSAVVLVYPAGREVLGNLANLHWVLFTAASTVLVCSWAGRRLELADIGLVVLTALSSPFAALLPLLALGGVLRRTPRAWIVTALLALATLPQVVSVLMTERAWSPAQPLSLGTMLEMLGAAAWQSWFGPGWTTSKLVVVVSVFLLTLVLVVSFIVLLRHDRRAGVLTIVVLAGLLGAALATTLLSLVWNGIVVERHLEPVAALSVSALALGAGVVSTRLASRERLAERRDRPALEVLARFLPLALLVAFGAGFASSFRVATDASPGPDVTAGIEAQRDECLAGATAINVPISPFSEPPSWTISIPCRELLAEDAPST